MARIFSLLDDSRIDEAYAVLQLVGKNIESLGRRQRISKTSLDTYRLWQSERANYIVTDEPNGPIIGLITLHRERLDDWPDHANLGHVSMLRALATHPDHVRTGIGDFAVRSSIEIHDNPSRIYLDCVSGFLPTYYGRLGFKPIAQQIRNYGIDGSFDITLMQFFE